MRPSRKIILSCEHAGNRVPGKYKKLFATNTEILNTHRGYDIGAVSVASRMQRLLDCPLCQYPWTRLLIEVNRSYPRFLYSEFSKKLDQSDKEDLMNHYYAPYRQALEELILRQSKKVGVLHISMHSFKPVLKGHKRNADIGILYDPSRKQEKQFAVRLQNCLREETDLRIRRNYPYLGRSDGVTTWLREKYTPTQYLGIEIELNQAFFISPGELSSVNFAVILSNAISKANE
jgi:predicted N-formylglutamate amidohydrolase